MIVFIEGKYTLKNPALVWIECQGIGYEVNISLHTYEQIQHDTQGRLLTYMQVKEDGFSLFGFYTPEERWLFMQLISVSGIGANTARMMLSSMKPEEIVRAIATDNEKQLEKIKGIGAKSAKRLILELKDKVQKQKIVGDIQHIAQNNMEEDALTALVSLGIARQAALQAIQKTKTQNPDINSTEDLIKLALKTL